MTFALARQRLADVAWERPILAAVALMNAITGGAALTVLAPLSLGADADVLWRGAIDLDAAYRSGDFLFSPLAATLFVPLTWTSHDIAVLMVIGVELAVLVVCVVMESRRLAPIDRVLVIIAVLGFLPVVNELLLGQVTVLIAAAVLVAIRAGDAGRNGIALGVVLALVPKPLLLPVLVWMALYRRRALLAAVLTASCITLVGAMALGVTPFAQWFDALQGAGEVSRNGNMSLWVDGPSPQALGLALLVAGLTAYAIRHDEDAGLVSSLLAGLLLAPYTLLYAGTILLLAVRPALRVAPRATRAFSLAANPVLIVGFAAWSLLALLVAGLGARKAPARTATR